jgi:hypothetical protein
MGRRLRTLFKNDTLTILGFGLRDGYACFWKQYESFRRSKNAGFLPVLMPFFASWEPFLACFELI